MRVRGQEHDATLTALEGDAPVRRPVVELAPGVAVGRYRIDRCLGAGGMGVVYAARDTELAREVALKIVRRRSEVDATQARLHREAKAMARLSHRNVVPVFDIGTHEGQLFIAMELVTGEPLRSWVVHPRPWRAVVQLFARAGRGLEAAHAAGLLHRDFKPDNVMVGAGDEPRITDFGLARELDDAGPSSIHASGGGELAQITATGSIAGTPAYMAPEQLRGNAGGPQADQFSFCVALFEVLYGVRPFRPSTQGTEAYLAEIRAARIVKPARTRGVPRWLHAAVVRGLAHDPERRWPSMRALVDALERRRGRRSALLAALAVIAVAVAVTVAVRSEDRSGAPAQDSSAPRCLDVARKGNEAVTILVCKDEYTRTGDPQVGAKLADAQRRAGRLEDARTLASELLATPARADALYALGKIAHLEDHREEAERLLRLASAAHRAQARWGNSAADLDALVGVLDDAIDQLDVLDQAMTDARRGGAPNIEAHGHLVAALRLSEIGAHAGALDELDRARSLMTEPDDLMQLELARGNVLQNLDEQALAVVAFERARAAAEAETAAQAALSARLNLVYSLAEAGRPADAAVELDAVRALDPRDRKRASRLALEARIAARAGDPARAAARIDDAVAATDADDLDDLFERETQRAEIALQRGELPAAERSARTAIALIEKLRSTHPPVELRSWMVTDRRIPYEVLFASLAGRGDAAGALAAFDRTRGLGVLARLTHGDVRTGAAFPVGELARLVPPLQSSALATAAPGRAVLDATRAASLLALVVARGELWRITADAGRLAVARIAPLSALRSQLERFRNAPGDRAIASELGALLVPAELARPSGRTLHVVLDDPLAWVPVPALRVGDRRLISARPIVQPARPSDLGCAARPDGPHRVVTLASAGAAPRAATTLEVTRTALFGVARGDLLHLAVPVASDALGDALVLRDGRVRALEIAGHGGAPSQVVLAGPDQDPGGTAALAMAYLAAGADQVIATVRPVSSAVLAQLSEQLHRSDLGDLSRALARIQAAEPENAPDDWFDLAAFGRTICNSHR